MKLEKLGENLCFFYLLNGERGEDRFGGLLCTRQPPICTFWTENTL